MPLSETKSKIRVNEFQVRGNMKEFFLFGLLLITFLTANCSGVVADRAPQLELNTDSLNEAPIKVSACDLANNPQDFNHKLVEVTGFVSHGFEDFSISDPSCTTKQLIWLEYGGTHKSGTMYCCDVSASRSRPEQLEVEEIPIPLTVDDQFEQFDKLVSQEHNTIIHATIVGRYFSGKKREDQDDPDNTAWRGYGHMGCCTLLAIEKIAGVDPHDRKDVDYLASYDFPELSKLDSYEIVTPNESPKDFIAAQQKADSGQREWSFNNPLRAASEALASITKVNEKSIKGISQIRQSQGIIVYHWRNRSSKASYLIIVSRPYWLSYFAKDSKRVAWVAVTVYQYPYQYS